MFSSFYFITVNIYRNLKYDYVVCVCLCLCVLLLIVLIYIRYYVPNPMLIFILSLIWKI